MSTDQTIDFLSILRDELAYSQQLIPKLEWAVRVAQAKLAVARADATLEKAINNVP